MDSTSAHNTSPPPRPVPVSPSSSIGSASEYTSLDSIFKTEGKAYEEQSPAFLFDPNVAEQIKRHHISKTSSSLEAARPMKVLFLSADTGGGHRASAESLANQIMIQFPGSTYELMDVWSDASWPYNQSVKSYKHLSANPSQWRLFYHLTNATAVYSVMRWHSAFLTERKIRNKLHAYDPDVIISVHPTMQYAPVRACRNMAAAQGKHIPFFTVVTDLNSAHGLWFDAGVDKIYLASDSLHKVAQHRAAIPERKIVRTGLPIRHDFAVQAEKLVDRNSPHGRVYQRETKRNLGISPDKPMVLLMGGGEGVGGLSAIVDEVYTSLTLDGIDATICVVCGRNEKLRTDLQERDWDAVLWKENLEDSFCSTSEQPIHPKLLMDQQVLGRDTGAEEKKDDDDAVAAQNGRHGDVTVIGLGFISRMAEYMVAAHILVTKAGPGTISEAAAVGLPVLLTSFLPGQEAKNVDFVVDNGFGAFCDNPVEIGSSVSSWLQDVDKLQQMSALAKETGHPNAAGEIISDIGLTTQAWMEINDQHRKSLRQRSSSSSWAIVDGISEFVVE